MKTFDEKDLITWANRDKAVIGNRYYFADSLDAIEERIKGGNAKELIEIDKYSCSYTFENSSLKCYACILPVDAVKESEEKYRACKTIQEFRKVVTGNTTVQSDGQYLSYLIGCKVHIRNKFTGTQYYTAIRNITIDLNNCIKIELSTKLYQPLSVFFENYEIEINGKWQPFGVVND